MTDLKPCPFCGRAPALSREDVEYLVCNRCHAYGPNGGVEAWNNRADDSPFKVGERVRNTVDGSTGVLKLATWLVDWDAPSSGRGTCAADCLQPVPDLPDDHIDRFWIPGARLRQKTYPYQVAVVNEAWGVKLFGKVLQPSATAKVNHGLTGWSFHPDSPIKEKREP